MAGASETDQSLAGSLISSPPGSVKLWQRSLWLLMLCSLVFVPGCGGCFNSSSQPPQTAEQRAEAARKKKEEELKKKKKEKKPDFEFGRLTLQPGARGAPSIFIKPGHWISAIQTTKTNNFDFVGELDAAIVDPNGDPIDLDRTAFRFSTSRPAALPKGQLKYLDMTFFVPHAMRRARLNSSLRGSYAGSSINREDTLFNAMPPYQYFMLVLARTPERYGFLNLPEKNFMFVPWSDSSTYYDDKVRQYFVVNSSSKQKPVYLPSDALTWTSMAYFFWDDVDPEVLSKEQQQALIDWIHWGGQLIINGPGSLSALKGSFLSAYLPASSLRAREYTTEDLQELNRHWTLPVNGKPGYPLSAAKPWSGMELQLHAEANKVPKTGGLLAERRIGLGRVCLSAIHLTQPELRQWPDFDGFFNSCVLRRGPRKWETGDFNARLAWAEGDPRPDDPSRVSQVRYFSRDAGSKLNYHVFRPPAVTDEDDYNNNALQLGPNGQIIYNTEDGFSDGVLSTSEPIAMGGVASWNPFSPVSSAARETLREAAGVDIPEPWFVLWVVGLYIIIVVPVNWLVFYVIGRLEWAWIAAPIVAVAFSVLVVRLAQLDIGFVRAETEIGVLELQPGYQRGHLTRYMALYTSLGTQYQLAFEDRNAVALPMPMSNEFELRPGQSFTTVSYRRFEEATLNDVTVSSNSTGMLHGEQMIKIDQPIRMYRTEEGAWKVRNGSEYDLETTAVVRRSEHSFHTSNNDSGKNQNSMQFAWIGSLKAGETKTLSFLPLTAENSPRHRRDDIEKTAPSGKLDLSPLYKIAESRGYYAPGEARLIGRIDQVIAGSKVTPEASQFRGSTLVVAHLSYGHLPAPQADLNKQDDVQQVELDFGTP